jgi:peptidyl-prolyl cis-trans isomerase SurA
MTQIKISLFILLSALGTVVLNAQQILVDDVLAVVGGNAIFRSDVESQYLQMKAQNNRLDDDVQCQIFEDLLIQKLLLNQAKVDSVEISEQSVESQLDNRMDYFIRQIGSKEKLEKYFNKSIIEIKEDFHDAIKNQMITEKMRSNITESVTITPSEVKKFYESLKQDSIPLINAQVEIRQILIYPNYTNESKLAAKDKLLSLRKRIIDGEKFSTLAVLYSEDPGSARMGGEIGFMSKAELDPEYAKTAFSLKVGSVSTIVESQFGYHIIQLIERQDDRANTRHILIKPKVSQEELSKAKARIDSIAYLIKVDTLTFEKAAMFFSQDKETFFNGGLVINAANQSSKFEMNEFPTQDFLMIKDLKEGDVSAPYETVDSKGKPVYKMVQVKRKIQPHKANITDDYQFLQHFALEDKKMKAISLWIEDKKKSTYYQINNSGYETCPFIVNWKK